MKQYKIKEFILPFMKRHWNMVLLLSFLIVFCALSNLLPSYALKYLLDNYLMEGNQNTSLGFLSCLYFLSYALLLLFSVLENVLIDFFGQKMIHELRYTMAKKAGKLTPSYFTHHGTGEMASRLTDDVNAIETLFASGLVTLIVSLFQVIGILVSVFVFSWMLGLILLFVLPFLYILTEAFRKRMLKNQMENRKVINSLNNLFSETAENLFTIQNLNGEDFQERQFENNLKESRRTMNKTAFFDSVYSPILQMLKSILIAVVFVLVSMGTEKNTFLGISVGSFAASISLISDVFSPLESIGQMLQEMQEGISGIRRVEEFMSEKEIPEEDHSITAEDILSKENLIELDDMSFRYDDGDKDVLSHISFVVRKGEKVVVKGRTGVGKTTMFRLLLGMNVPTGGEVLIGGKKASSIPGKEKKKIFGYVEQGFSSIDGSIEEQITTKDASISLEQVREAMKKVFLDDYVMKEIPDGYQAKFSEKLFSRGQLQLLSLARALVQNPKILLLDEISANLDSETENKILQALYDVSQGRTVLSISHRLSERFTFDKTIEIDNGITKVDQSDSADKSSSHSN